MPHPPLIRTLQSLLDHIPLSAFVYASGAAHYYDGSTNKKIKAGTCVGIRFGQGNEAPLILFKNVIPLKNNPQKLKKALDMAAKLNIMEGTKEENPWVGHFIAEPVDLNINIKNE